MYIVQWSFLHVASLYFISFLNHRVEKQCPSLSSPSQALQVN